MGIATAASRVLGLVREQTVALLFGAGMETDAFNVAFRIPNLLRDLFAEGALSSAFVPTFTSVLTKEGKEQAFKLGRRVFGALLLVVGALVLVGIVLSPLIVRVIAPGIWAIPGKGELTVLMTRIMLPFLLLIALAALAMGMLNSLGHYFLPAFAPVMLNLGMIVVGSTLAILAPSLGITPVLGLAIGAMVGGFGQLAIQIPSLLREGFRASPLVDFSDPKMRHVLFLMGPAALGLAATEINILVNTQIASLLPQGSISWLAYAFRLMQLPIGVFGVSIATVMLPVVARHLASSDRTQVSSSVERALSLVFTLTVPASVALAVLSRPIVDLLYQYRMFTAFDADQTAQALQLYAIGLVGFSAVKVLGPVFYALGEASTPVKASFIAVGVNIALNLALMQPMAHRGLALATSITGLLNLTLLLAPLTRRLGRTIVTGSATCLTKVIVASGVMAIALRMTSAELAAMVGSQSVFARLALVGGSAAVGVVVFAIAARILGISEWNEVYDLIKRKLLGSAVQREQSEGR